MQGFQRLGLGRTNMQCRIVAKALQQGKLPFSGKRPWEQGQAWLSQSATQGQRQMEAWTSNVHHPQSSFHTHTQRCLYNNVPATAKPTYLYRRGTFFAISTPSVRISEWQPARLEV
eukprot:scaffold65524_cov17-Tisochrysis_lutea.AAC.2